MKRKMNKLKGKAGFPASRKERASTPLEDSPISVLFVDSTKGGVMAKRFREEEKRLGQMTGYNIRVAEMAGMPLSRLLPSTNPWGPGDCGRADCPVCDQGDEKNQNCKKRNILYESSCQECNPEEDERSRKSNKLSGCEGVYIGESRCSLYERAGEHLAYARGMKEDSHIVKHWATSNPEMTAAPKFRMKVISSFQDSLTRQISESVRIGMRGGRGILNSKTEFKDAGSPD